MRAQFLSKLVHSGAVRRLSRSAAVRPKIVPLVKLHDLLDAKAAEPDALVASFKALHGTGVKLPLFFYEKAVQMLCQRHDSVRVEYLLHLSREATTPPESQLLSRPVHDSFEILSSTAIGMLARYGAAGKGMKLWKNLASADFVANRKSLEMMLHQLALSKAMESMELPLKLFKVLQNNGWAGDERSLHDFSKIITLYMTTGCTTEEELRAALGHAEELWQELGKLDYVSLTLHRTKATTMIAAAQASRRLQARALDDLCYAAARQAFHEMVSAIQHPILSATPHAPKRSSLLNAIFQTDDYASTFRPGHVDADEDIALLLQDSQSAGNAVQTARTSTDAHDQLFGSLVLGKERQELFLSVRRIAEAMCSEHAARGDQEAAIADLVRCMSAFPHGPETSPLARVAGVGARPGSPAFGYRSLFATSFAEVMAAYQPHGSLSCDTSELLEDINGFAQRLLKTMHDEHITPTADFHAAWIRALPVAGEASIEAAKAIVAGAHPVICNSVQVLEARVDFLCKFSDEKLLERAYDLYLEHASQGVRSIGAMTQLVMSATTSHRVETLSNILAEASHELQRNQWAHAKLADMGDFLLAQLYGYARLRDGYRSLRILMQLQRIVSASKAEANQQQGHRQFTIPRKAYRWTLSALTMSEAQTDEEKRIESNPTSTCEWVLQDMLKQGHTCDADLAAVMLKLHARTCQRHGASNRERSFNNLAHFYEQLKRGHLNHPPLGDDRLLVKEFIRAALSCEFEDIAQRVIDQRREAGVADPELLEPLFFYYAKIKRSLNETEDLLSQLNNAGTKPTPAIIDIVAECHATSGEVGAALDWIQESLAQYQVRCTPKGFLRVLDILLENGDADQVRRAVGLIPSIFGDVESAPESTDRISQLYPQLPRVRQAPLAVAELTPPTLAHLTRHNLEQRFRRFGFEL